MLRSNPLPAFAAATLTAPTLVALGALWGGAWVISALIWITLLTALMDEFITLTLPTATGDEFPAATALATTLVAVHFALWAIVLAALGGATGLTTWEKLVLFGAAGLFFGQVSNSNAHELVHRSNRALRAMGKAVYVSMLYGHHASAHTLVHHVHVATRADPNSARPGEGYYRFLARAWPGEFRAGLRAERARLQRGGKSAWQNPYLGYAAGGLAALLIAFMLGDLKGLVGALFLAGFAQSQLLLSDYVQHYGLTRAMKPNGKPEPVGPEHSWNSPHAMSSALMLNAPRHSDHHMKPARPYPALKLDSAMPTLPHALPVMACIALVPPVWRNVMGPRIKQFNANQRPGRTSG